MKLRTLFFFLIVLLPITAAAQFTQVSATVTDPNGLAYANGTVVAKLVLPGGTSPTLNGLAYTPPSQPVGLNTNGFFLMQLADNNVLLPAATQWSFTVCSAAGTVQPAGGRGPVCFNAGPITITGASQSITATLNAAALALSFAAGGTIGGSIANTQIAVGSGANTIQGFANFTATTPAATVVNGTVTAGIAGSVGGVLAAAGVTAGTSTWTPAATASTATNPFASSNVIAVPAGTTTAPSYGLAGGSSGLWFVGTHPYLGENGTPNFGVLSPNGQVALSNGSGYCWTTGAVTGTSPDTCSWRDTAGTIDFGNATAQDKTSTLRFRHAGQGATGDWAGTCAMAAGTTCTITLSAAFTSTPICIVTVQSATLTGGVAGCTVSGTTVTITAATANSLTWGAILAGNPN